MEEGIFDKVEIYFLIVGHTHASIDQYFSVLANQINRSDFIGSPLALEHLFATIDSYNVNPSGTSWKRQGNRKQKSLPLAVQKLSVIFDIKTALLKLTNPNVKYYSIPHCFLFHRINSVSIMQYKVFSSGEWLPKFPENTTDFNMSEQLSVKLQHFDVIGGEDKFLSECGVGATTTNMSVLSTRHKKAVEVMSTLTDLGDTLKALEIQICHSVVSRSQAYYETLFEDSKAAKQLVSEHKEELNIEVIRHMLNQNNAERGFICWLKPDVSRVLNPEPLNLKPALKYLITNELYESTGYDVFDIFDEDLDTQYQKIMTILNTAADDLTLTRSRSKLVVPSFLKLRSLYWEEKENNLVPTPADDAFIKSTHEIVSTATMVIHDVIDKRIMTSNSKGTYCCQLFYYYLFTN